PPEGMDRRSYLETKFGGKENAVRVYARIAQAAEAAGLTLNLEGIARTPNTIDAHRLIHWAGLEGRQTAVVSRLFRAYFEDGEDIGDRDVLLDIAAGVGLDREMTARLFESDADVEHIRARDAHGRERGVTGVPTFVLANRHVLQGAQPTELWTKAIGEIEAQLRAAG
ncbi:MAG: DsbA family oxidoreductase, partial [Paracoccaceae bacterium]|nr:DsbA family oxidoreductase [Paracoccaceae bacterium]